MKHLKKKLKKPQKNTIIKFCMNTIIKFCIFELVYQVLLQTNNFEFLD